MKDPKSSDLILYLSGWKDIAKYLGRGVRSVQRYERDLGLPIRRPAGKARGSVIATAAELDAWVHAKPLQGSFDMRRELPNDNAALVDLKKALAEHHRLREEMSMLRSEMHESMRRLRARLQTLEADKKDDSQQLSSAETASENLKRRPN